MTQPKLNPVDKVEILIVVDNYSDVLLTPGPHVERPVKGRNGRIDRNTLLAEHGLCLLITVHSGGESHSIMLDAGYSDVAAMHNVKLLGVDLSRVEAIVLSHGHMDHFGSLKELLGEMNAPTPVYLHPAAFCAPRFISVTDDLKLEFPRLAGPEEIASWGGEARPDREPVLLAGGTMLLSGQVPRVTGFERGMPNALVEENGVVTHDHIPDDMFLVMEVRDQGLVVISGCAHAGIINSVLQAQKLTGRDEVLAIAGGFHLNGPLFEPIIEDTVANLKKMNPKVIAPMHCTGWTAQHRLAQEFGERFVLTSVGSKLTLGG